MAIGRRRRQCRKRSPFKRGGDIIWLIFYVFFVFQRQLRLQCRKDRAHLRHFSGPEGLVRRKRDENQRLPPIHPRDETRDPQSGGRLRQSLPRHISAIPSRGPKRGKVLTDRSGRDMNLATSSEAKASPEGPYDSGRSASGKHPPRNGEAAGSTPAVPTLLKKLNFCGSRSQRLPSTARPDSSGHPLARSLRRSSPLRDAALRRCLVRFQAVPLRHPPRPFAAGSVRAYGRFGRTVSAAPPAKDGCLAFFPSEFRGFFFRRRHPKRQCPRWRPKSSASSGTRRRCGAFHRTRPTLEE